MGFPTILLTTVAVMLAVGFVCAGISSLALGKGRWSISLGLACFFVAAAFLAIAVYSNPDVRFCS